MCALFASDSMTSGNKAVLDKGMHLQNFFQEKTCFSEGMQSAHTLQLWDPSETTLAAEISLPG